MTVPPKKRNAEEDASASLMRAKIARSDDYAPSNASSSPSEGDEDDVSSMAEPSMASKSSSSKQRPKKYFCTHEGCDKAFNRPVHLEAHVRTHTGQRPFVCKEEGCDKAFFKSQHLKAHVHNNHSGIRDHVCDFVVYPAGAHEGGVVCGMTFSTASRLKNHRATHKKVEELRCSECGLPFRKMETMQRHIKRDHLGEDTYICDYVPAVNGVDAEMQEQCGKAFVGSRELKRHQQQEHGMDGGKKYFCESCFPLPSVATPITTPDDSSIMSDNRPSFPSYAALQVHIKMYHPPTCDQCGKVCISNKQLTAHIDIEHGTSLDDRKARFPCSDPGCDRTFTRKGNLNVHFQSVHAKLKRFVCGQVDGMEEAESGPGGKLPGWTDNMGCGMGFATKSTLQGHIRTQHLDLQVDRKKPNTGKNKEKGVRVKSEPTDSPMQTYSPPDFGSLHLGTGTQLSSLTGHAYADIRPFACLERGCTARYKREYDLKMHLQFKHGYEDDNQQQDTTLVQGDKFWVGGGDFLDEEDDLRANGDYDFGLAPSFPQDEDMGHGMMVDPELAS